MLKRNRKSTRLIPGLSFKGSGVLLLASAGSIFLVAYLSSVFRLLDDFNKFDDWRLEDVHVRAAAFFDGAVITVNSLRAATGHSQPPKTSALPTVHLRLEPGSLEYMTKDPKNRAREKYFRAWLFYPDGKWRPVKYRLRGRSIWHWQRSKPSLRLKLKRSQPINMQRRINLIVPEDRPMIANYYGDQLAAKLGVLAHETRFIRLFVNGRFMGVYHQTTHEDESLLRLKKRMPGPIYLGEQLKIKWAARDFEIVGETKGLNGRAPLAEMIDALYSEPGPERYDQLWRILSEEQYAKWLAVMNIASSTHVDYGHNNAFYFDPGTGKLEPMIVDINGHSMLLFPPYWQRIFRFFDPAEHTIGINERNYSLLNIALRDPRFYHRRNVILYAALRGQASTESQIRDLTKIADAIRPDVYADRYKAGLKLTLGGHYPVPYDNDQFDSSVDDVKEWVKKRNRFLLAELEHSEVSVDIENGETAELRRVIVSVSGHAAIRFDPGIVGDGVKADRDFDGTPETDTARSLLLYPGLAEIDKSLWSQPIANDHDFPHLVPAPQYYVFSAPDNVSVPDLAERLRGAFRQSLNKKIVLPAIRILAPGDRKPVSYNSNSVHSWKFPEARTDTVVLGPGPVTLTRNLEIDENQKLVVLPGTRLFLGPDVSIFSRGQVKMEGTSEAPIEVDRLIPKAPWGVIALQSRSARGSVLRHVTLAGGSGARHRNVIYTGMLSAHWVPDVTLNFIQLQGNSGYDDALHVVHGNVLMKSVALTDCFADCIDLDHVEAVMTDLTIQNAGNDGVDFMESRAEMQGVFLAAIGDKGLSIGERSSIQATDVSVENADIGIAVKDGASLDLGNARLSNNRVAISAFSKNWRYGASGLARLETTVFSGNAVDVSRENGGIIEMSNAKSTGESGK
jgi:hypothetical protein